MLFSNDLGLYLYETKKDSFEGPITRCVIHDDPEGKHVTFFATCDGKQFIGSLVTKNISKEVMNKLQKREEVIVKGKIKVHDRFKTSGPTKEDVIPLRGRLYIK
jgi:hypothetical protein